MNMLRWQTLFKETQAQQWSMHSEPLRWQKLHSSDRRVALGTRWLSLNPQHDGNIVEPEFNSPRNDSLCKWTQRMDYDINDNAFGKVWQFQKIK